MVAQLRGAAKISSMCNKSTSLWTLCEFLNFTVEEFDERRNRSNLEASKFLVYEINMQTHCKLSISDAAAMK